MQLVGMCTLLLVIDKYSSGPKSTLDSFGVDTVYFKISFPLSFPVYSVLCIYLDFNLLFHGMNFSFFPFN